jgi:protein-disulfide isomerase
MSKRRPALFQLGRASAPMLAMALLLAGLAPAGAEGFSADQRAEIESIVKNLLVEKPEILREAAAELDAREKLAEAKIREEIVGNPSGPLYSGTNQAVIGNPVGKITLIEFFDYNCGYCKRALTDLAKLMKDNPDLRVILRDLPILSPSSIDAAKIANAANNQFKGAKFWEFHQKLLGSRGQIGKSEAMAVAKELGADMDKLARDAAAPAVAEGVEESEKFARSLQITGTPSYVIGEEVVIGAVGFEDLQAKVVNTRKCGKAMC